MTTTTQEQVADLISNALDAVLAVVVLVGGLPADVPDDALDAALVADEGVRAARRGFQAALRGVRDVGVVGEPYLALEAACNAVSARCAEVGFRLGVRVGRDVH